MTTGQPARPNWFAIVSVVLGVLGCVVWLSPTNLDGVRAYSPLPFALVGLVAGFIGASGRRRGLAVAVTGAVLSAVALALSIAMITGLSSGR
jgi:prepilin signal peptidase PulO-like enzyme (type II secretory pathway)